MRLRSLAAPLIGSLFLVGAACNNGGELGGSGGNSSTASSSGVVASSSSTGALSSSSSGDVSSSSGSTSSSSSGGSSSSGACVDTCPFANGVTVGCEKRFMYGVNYAWANWGQDFGGTTGGVTAKKADRTTDLTDMKNSGVDVIRWWMWQDFDNTPGITFDSAGTPNGITPTAVKDIQTALDIAAQTGVHLQFTLFSFDNLKKVKNLAPIAIDNTKRLQLIDTLVKQTLNAVATSSHPERLHSWDIINEPEWSITGNDGVDQDFGPCTTGTANCQNLTYAQMSQFVHDVAAAIHSNSDKPVTVGSAAVKWAHAWNSAGLDFYTVHWYDWVEDWYPHTQPPSYYGFSGKPVVVGEFPLGGFYSGQTKAISYQTLVHELWTNGYAGAMGWAENDSSDPSFSWSTNKASVAAFATTNTCQTRY